MTLGELMIPQVLAIRKEYEEKLPSIQKFYEGRLSNEIRKMQKWLYGGAFVGFGILAGGVAFAMLKAILAIVAGGFILGAAAVGGILVYNMLPRWQMALAHSERLKIEAEMQDYLLKRMRMRDEQIQKIQDEVRANPVGFLQDDYNRRKKLYEAQRVVVTKFAGRMGSHVQNFERKKKDYPNMDLSGEQMAIERMQLFHKNRMDRLNTGFQLLNRFAAKVEEARTHWELKKSAAEALDEERRMGFDPDAEFQNVLSEIAFDTVNTEFQTVFAQIEVDAQEMTAKQLEFAPNLAIDVTDSKLLATSVAKGS